MWAPHHEYRIRWAHAATGPDRCTYARRHGADDGLGRPEPDDTTSLHSDWNATPVEPLRYVEDAVTRIMADGGEVLNEHECIAVDAALRAVTIDAAWQCRADEITGSIEVGKYADFVLLEQDPTAIDPTAIAQITVSETRLAGETRYSS